MITEDEMLILNPNKMYYRNLNNGEKFKMHGISRNNPAESVAGHTKWSKIRSTIPPISISIWVENAIRTRDKFLKHVHDMHAKNIPYSSIAIRFVENNDERLTSLEIINIQTMNHVRMFKIDEVIGDHRLIRQVTIVGTSEIKCDCAQFNEYDIYCPHIMKALKDLRHMMIMTREEYIPFMKN